MGALADPEEVEDFLGKVNEVSMLIEGLQKGTLSPDYIDRRQDLKQQKELERQEAEEKKHALASAHKAGSPKQQATTNSGINKGADQTADEAADEEEARRERAMAKVQEMLANRDRKLRARARYEEYVHSKDTTMYGTDYTKWDIWCPEDDEDDMFNSIPPSTPEFRALEKDIDERHRKMVEARQVAERCRVRGNEAFKMKQYSEALRCYQQGIDSERTNMALHANAAMAALKLQCYVQAIEHCDKVLSIADFLHNNKKDPLCVKALQRRATAYSALQQHTRAVEDLEAALAIEPGNEELLKQLPKAKLDLDEHRKQRRIQKALAKGDGGGQAATVADIASSGAACDGPSLDLEKLGQVEQLVGVLAPQQLVHVKGSDATAAAVSHATDRPQASPDNGDEPVASTSRGPMLPPRKGARAASLAAALVNGTSSSAGSGRAAVLAGACKQLQALLRNDDTCCVHFRACGGLQHAASQAIQPEAVPAGEPEVSRAPFLALLNDACMNDGNLKQLPLLKVLPACASCLGSEERGVAAMAVNLLSTAATNEDVRKQVSEQLAGPGRLVALLGMLKSAVPSVQAVALALLSNCMVDRPTKAAAQAMWMDPSTPAGFAALLRSPSCDVAERAATLLGNMCTDAVLRQAIAALQELLDGLAGLVMAPSEHLHVAGSGSGAGTGTEAGQAASTIEQLQLAAAATVYNLVVEPLGQAYVAARPQLLSYLLSVLEAESSGSMLQARAAGTVARVAKDVAAAAELLRLGALAKMVRVGAAALDTATPVAGQANGAGRRSDGQQAVLDAAVRTMTVLTTPDSRELAAQLTDAGGPAMLLRVARTEGMPEALLGNAALCLAGLARYKEQLPRLREADAVAALVKVAYHGKGNTASKNAAIALARMAQDPAMLERLRELHGVEIIYQYVKP